MPAWLWRSIISIAFAISVLSAVQWGTCRFYVFPSIWPVYVNGMNRKEENKIDTQLMGCNDVDSRTIAVMMGVLTTLISLSRKAE
jgi:hypothetical protein